MTRAALLAAILALPAYAQSSRVWEGYGPSSVIELHAPTAENARASMTFHNTPVHQADEEFTLTWDGVNVHVQFDWQADAGGAERIIVTPPEGMVAIPPEATVAEEQTQVIHIYEWEGM